MLVVGIGMVMVAPEVALFAYLPIPVILWGSLHFQRRLEPRYREVRARAIRLSAAFIPLIRFAILFAFLAILLIGGFKALAGELPVATYSVLVFITCLLYTSPSPRDVEESRMPSSA